MLYDLIEERGLDYVMRRLTKAERHDRLYRTADEELVMYFVIGLSPKEMFRLFDVEVVQRVLAERMPPENLFYSLEGDQSERLYTARGFARVFEDLAPTQFLQDCRVNAAAVVRAVEKGLISRDDFLGKIKYFTLEQICILKKFHDRFSDFLQPLYRLALYSIFPVRSGSGFRDDRLCDRRRSSARRAFNTDVGRLILSFL
jgi:hypothetical protein